jgi:hypothetical protein
MLNDIFTHCGSSGSHAKNSLSTVFVQRCYTDTSDRSGCGSNVSFFKGQMVIWKFFELLQKSSGVLYLLVKRRYSLLKRVLPSATKTV